MELAALEPLPPDILAAELPEVALRRRFVQMAIIVELCRHPKSDAQLRLVDAYGEALRVGGTELEAVRAEAEMSTTAATVDHVSHDMNHVITGYEPTGPGEIGLVAFKLAMNDSDANWMAWMVNLMIHEVGPDQTWQRRTVRAVRRCALPGARRPVRGVVAAGCAPELVAEAFARGAACTADFSRADHLALAPVPLAEVRKRFHVIPLAAPMRPDEDPGLWPARA